MAARPKALDTIITWLEMTVPPAKRYQLPLGVNAAILHAEKPQLSFYRFLQFQVGYPWNWETRLRLDDKTLTAAIHTDTTEVYVLYLDGAPAGFYEVNRADPAVSDLAFFGLMPHAAGAASAAGSCPGPSRLAGRASPNGSRSTPAPSTIRRPCRSTRSSASGPATRRPARCGR